MFKTNMGGMDRIIRGIVGIVLLALYFMGSVAGLWAWLALIVGVVLLATAVIGWCPAYMPFGINTCATKKG